jgi:hypothetical protein
LTYPKLDEAELQQLQEFAAVEGRFWKSTLRKESWWRGLPCRDRKGKEYPHLYGLRNTHGNTWLEDFSFKKELAQ